MVKHYCGRFENSQIIESDVPPKEEADTHYAILNKGLLTRIDPQGSIEHLAKVMGPFLKDRTGAAVIKFDAIEEDDYDEINSDRELNFSRATERLTAIHGKRPEVMEREQFKIKFSEIYYLFSA